MKKWEIIGSGGSSGTTDLSEYYKKSEVDSKIENLPEKSKVYTKDEINTKVNELAKKSETYSKSETYNKSEVDSKISSSGNFNPALYYTKPEVDNKFNDASIVKDGYSKPSLQLNTNVKIKGTLQKDNTAQGDPDEDYITTSYFGNNFNVFFDQKINEITGGDVNNLVLKNKTYTSAPLVFNDTVDNILLNVVIDGKSYNNFEVNYIGSVLTLTNPTIGQSGIIKIKGAKNIRSYDSKLKSTTELPVGDKLNDTEYFTYYVFSDTEILFSRI